MPMPNVDDKDIKTVFNCTCMEDSVIIMDHDPKWDTDTVTFWVKTSVSFWDMLRHWWRGEPEVQDEHILTRKDVIAMRDALTKWIQETEK